MKRIRRHYFRRENSGMVCIPNILSYSVYEYTIHGESSSSMVALSTTRIAWYWKVFLT